MQNMKNIIFAGASFPCGVGEMGAVALKHGFAPTFVDHPRNASSTDAGLLPLRFEPELPEDVALRSGLFLPLLESWVSEGRNLPERAKLRFDKRAATISRSEQALSATLADAGITHVRRFRVATVEEALLAASVCDYPAVLRSDTGYSGRGIWVADSAEELRSCWVSQEIEREGADYAEMRSVLDSEDDATIIEPWLAGEEWSIDCIVGPAGNYLIRVCEKATAIVYGKPVTLGYRIVDEVELLDEMRQSAQRWCRAIFQGDVVSFACFDIRRHSNGDLVPLDFGVRLGGDGIPYLVRLAGQCRNAYAAALDAALADDSSRMVSLSAGYALIHAFARQPGAFAGLAVIGDGEVINSKPLGFVVPQTRVPVHRRVGSILRRFDTRDEFLHACQISSEWIQVDVRQAGID